MNKRDANPAGELYCDTRLGGIKRWYYGKPEDADMRIPRDVVKSVGFLCVKATDDYGQLYDHFIGTAFFVFSHLEAEPHTPFIYLVTADHVLQDAMEKGYSEFFVRLNTRQGTSETIPLPNENEWSRHENPGVDVAVIPLAPDYGYFDYYPLPAGMFLFTLPERDEVGQNIGIGDDLFVTGLFSHRWGHQRNIPIVRSGIIAAMPDEPLIYEDKKGDPHLYRAFLAEMRSIGGLSGSPVFVLKYPRTPHIFKRDIADVQDSPAQFARFLERCFEDEPTTYLLGMIRGHWDLKRQGEDSVYREADAREIDKLNTGIASITPAWDINDVLRGKELMKQRKQAEKERSRQTAPTQDSNLPAPQAETESVKNPAAVALGLLGGSKGGQTRAANLSPARRKAIAKKAAKTRWSKAKKSK